MCVAFYPDTDQTMSRLTLDFFRKKNISISQSNVNLIVNKCNGDREILKNELKKVGFFSRNGKKLINENLTKLINLAENHSITELVDNCLMKNNKNY